METILIIGIVQSIIFLVLNAQKAKKTKADAILLTWLVVFGCHLSLLFLIENELSHRFVVVVAKSIVLLHGPLLFIYSCYIFRAKNTTKLYWHIFPFFLFVISGLLINNDHVMLWEGSVVVAKVLSILIYPTFTLIWLYKRKAFFKREKSDSLILEIRWISTLAYLLLFTYLISILLIVVNELFNLDIYENYDIIIYVIMITVMGYYGLKLGVVYRFEGDEITAKSESTSSKSYKHSPLDAKKIDKIEQLVESFFNSNDRYLNPDFSLTELSNDLDVPKHHLSQVINSEMKTTFYDIVNSKRVEHVINQLKSDNSSNLTLEALGYDAGFNTKAAFYLHFKKTTGLTPGQFKKKISID